MFCTVFLVRKESNMKRLMRVLVVFEDQPMPDDDPQPITE